MFYRKRGKVSWFYRFLKGCVTVWLLLWIFLAYDNGFSFCRTVHPGFMFFGMPHTARIQGPLLALMLLAWLSFSFAQALWQRQSARYLLALNMLGIWGVLLIFAQPLYKPLYGILFGAQALGMYLRGDFRHLQRMPEIRRMDAPLTAGLKARQKSLSSRGLLSLGIALMLCFPWAVLPVVWLLVSLWGDEPDGKLMVALCTTFFATIPTALYLRGRYKRRPLSVNGLFPFIFLGFGLSVLLRYSFLPYCGELGRAKLNTAKANAYSMQTDLEDYATVYRRYPEQLKQLRLAQMDSQWAFAKRRFLNPYDREDLAMQDYGAWMKERALQPQTPRPQGRYTEILGLRLYAYGDMFLEAPDPPPAFARGRVLYQYMNPQAYMLYVVKGDGTLLPLGQS
jgi:hypothetical protein